LKQPFIEEPDVDEITDIEEIADGETVWRFERSFLLSNWTCIWGRGCKGILPEPTEHLGQGCCSFGAEIDGDDEARLIEASAAALRPDRFEQYSLARAGGVFSDDTYTNTRVIDGACVFLNRPGFPGGEGCALHLAARDVDESPIDWKPSVCWQLPIRVDWAIRDDGTEVAGVRGWRRADWAEDGDAMAWCCTEGTDAYIGTQPVIDSLAEELEAIVGKAVVVELRRRLAQPDRIDL
jgi:hypothetical protein